LSLPELAGPVPEQGEESGAALRDTAIADAVARFGTVASCEPLGRLTHVFTHFKLHISPFRINLASRLDFAGQCSHVWYDAAKLSHAPLPAPVKKLLLGIFDGTARLDI
jgi:A/G-specific adenine glycosylase